MFEMEAKRSGRRRLLLTMAAAGGSYFINAAYEQHKIIQYVLTVIPLYNVKGVALESVDSYKDLGVIVDSHLLFDKHISEKVNKAYSMLGSLKRNFKDVSGECFINLYKTMVRPIY